MEYINIYYTDYRMGKIIGLDLCTLEFIIEAEKNASVDFKTLKYTEL